MQKWSFRLVILLILWAAPLQFIFSGCFRTFLLVPNCRVKWMLPQANYLSLAWKSIGFPPQFLDTTSYNLSQGCDLISKIRGIIAKLMYKDLWYRNLTRNMKNLAIFLKLERSHFSKIMRVISVSLLYIRNLEIHRIPPYSDNKPQVTKWNVCLLCDGRFMSRNIRLQGRNIRIRPPPGLKKAGYNLSLCLRCTTTNPNWSSQSSRRN